MQRRCNITKARDALVWLRGEINVVSLLTTSSKLVLKYQYAVETPSAPGGGGTPGGKTKNPQNAVLGILEFFLQFHAFSRNDYPSLNSRPTMILRIIQRKLGTLRVLYIALRAWPAWA